MEISIFVKYKTNKQFKIMRIESIKGREILDSRGNPTVEVEVRLLQEHQQVKTRLLNCAITTKADTAVKAY